MKLEELAKRITAHLKRFEADPESNSGGYAKPYYHAHAYRAGSRLWVTYITYQGPCSLTKDEATRYLAWLDAGNVGHHYRMLEQER